MESAVQIWLKRYDKNGRMYEAQKPLRLRRKATNENPNRWYVHSGYPF